MWTGRGPEGFVRGAEGSERDAEGFERSAEGPKRGAGTGAETLLFNSSISRLNRSFFEIKIRYFL